MNTIFNTSKKIYVAFLAIFLFISLILVFYLYRVAFAASFVVNSTSDAVDANPGNGVCATTFGDCTLRASIQEANALSGQDVILLPAGVYSLTILGRSEDFAAEGDLDINDDIVILGAAADSTIIDGNTIDRIFHIGTSGTPKVTISGVTIQNGLPGPADARGSADGGGVNIEPSSSVTITQSIVTDNAVDPTFGGGGIINRGSLILSQTFVGGNLSYYGGGLLNTNGAQLTIMDSSISNQTITGPGGAIYNSDNGLLMILRSTLSNNTASIGGGILSRGTLILENSTISDNAANSNGGGIYIDGRIEYLTSISNSTISYNSGMLGSEIYVYYSNPQFKNTIIFGNVPGANCFVASALIISNGSNLENGNTCNFSTPNDLVNTDPLLGQIQNNGGFSETRALLMGSPAIDSASDCFDNTGNLVSFDQRGVLRPQGSACDIGAYELEVIINTPTPTLTDTPSPTPTDSPTPTSTPTIYDFNGFFHPVDNIPMLNETKAGGAIPIKFSLNGDQGLDIFEVSYPKSQFIECNSVDPVDGIEETVSTGNGLIYDQTTDQYTYVWKTDKSWAGTCRQFVIKFIDGTTYQANFKFK